MENEEFILGENTIGDSIITNNKVEFSADNENLEKIKENKIIYGIKMSRGINQTLIWKILKKVYENKDDEGIKLANKLKVSHPEEFANAVKCLVSKKRIDYINSIC